MTMVSQAFHQFLCDLELTESEQKEASRQQDDLRDRLCEKLEGVSRHVLVGSYGRKTAIRPLNDIDVFFVLDAQVNGVRRDREPLLLLEVVQRALRECYPPPPSSSATPSPTTRIQGRSVHIEFTGTGIGYDVIPAFSLTRDKPPGSLDAIYEIPDRNQQTWIKTNPEVHKQRCIEANERAGGMLNRLIKAVKHWNQEHRGADGHKPLRSFHLEVMAYGAFSAKPMDERRGLAALFEHLSNHVDRPCPDPAGLGSDIGADLRADRARLERAQRLLRDAAQKAREAIQHEERGDHAKACAAWRAVLGPKFRY